jgi:hypothetical protein
VPVPERPKAATGEQQPTRAVVQIGRDADGTVLRFAFLPMQSSESGAEPTSDGPPSRCVGIRKGRGLRANGRGRGSHAESSGAG